MFQKQLIKKNVSNEKELDDEIEKFILNGYKIKYRDSRSVLLKERNYGEIPIHFVLYVFFLVLLSILSIDTSAESFTMGFQYLAGILAFLPYATIINVAYILYSMYFSNEFLIEIGNKKTGFSKSLNNKRFCKNCGAELKPDEDFCTECGTFSRVNNS